MLLGASQIVAATAVAGSIGWPATPSAQHGASRPLFQVQGIGNDLLTGISNHDAPLVEGITLVFALVTVFGNLLADLAYAVLDPRIRYGSSNS